MEQTALNANAKRRIHPGTKSADMAAGPPLIPLNEVRPIVAINEVIPHCTIEGEIANL